MKRANSFRPTYAAKLNSCIDWRYRKKGFSIVYAVLDDCNVSDVIDLRNDDRIIQVGMDSKTHRTKKEDGEYPYPNQDHILNQLMPVDELVVSGFHMWDCVDKLARRAYEREINTLVDEDLTEFFPHRILKDRDFRVKRYPTYNPKRRGGGSFQRFIEARKDKPWLWQDY